MLEYWYAALAAPYGVVLQTDDREKLRQKLYAIRREVKDPSLDGISIILSPIDTTEVWLIKRRPDGPAEESSTSPKGDIKPV